MDVKIEESWKHALQAEWDKPYFELLTSFVRNAYQTRQCFPPGPMIFSAFNSCPFDRVRVVIIGQDPYHDVGQAMGLCFLVPDGVPAPPSLVNIRKEIEDERQKGLLPPALAEGGVFTPRQNPLAPVGERVPDLSGGKGAAGVLLLNATLTVEAHRAGSHQGKGWEELTDAAIAALSREREHIVYMLWGSYAQRKGQIVDRRRNLVLTAPHPSPLSAYRGFIGCGHFAAANDYLVQHGQQPIVW